MIENQLSHSKCLSSIRAATVDEAGRNSGDWVFVDLGFANKAKSCGLLVGDGVATALTFSQLQFELAVLCAASSAPMHLVLEAPLSAAFGANGNPVGRSVEKREGQSRYWYVGLGCSVLVAATYLLRSIHDLSPVREIRLFEGLVSFKPKGVPSSHTKDVSALREVAWNCQSLLGKIVAPTELALNRAEDSVVSAFKVAGMDFGIPPVIVVDGHY